MLNVPCCLIGQPWLAETSTGASFDLLRHRKRARKVTVNTPQHKGTKFTLRINLSFPIFLEQSDSCLWFSAAVWFMLIMRILYCLYKLQSRKKGICQGLLSEPSGISINLLVIESKQPHQKNFSRIAQRIRKRSTKTLSHFEPLCCGILTIETSDCFLRSFCFTGQNGAFSTTEQNEIKFSCFFSIILLAIHPLTHL